MRLLLLLASAVLMAAEPVTNFPLDPLSKTTITVTDGDKKYDIPSAMVLIPTGDFTYGTGSEAHAVTLPAYAIGKYSVTNAEYQKFVDAGLARAPTHWPEVSGVRLLCQRFDRLGLYRSRCF